MASHGVTVTPSYLASVLDRAIVGFFLLLHAITVIVPFGSGSLRESSGNRWGFGLGGGRI